MKLQEPEEYYPPSFVKIVVHNVLWMYPFVILPYDGEFLDTRTRGGECCNETLLCIYHDV